jgi:hypothetical protein
VTLSVAQTARVDFKMEVGNIQERVDVFAAGAVLQADNAVVGIKADREQVEKLPAISRSVSFVTMYARYMRYLTPGYARSHRLQAVVLKID